MFGVIAAVVMLPEGPARDSEELAKEFGPSAQAIRNWVAQAERARCASTFTTRGHARRR